MKDVATTTCGTAVGATAADAMAATAATEATTTAATTTAATTTAATGGDWEATGRNGIDGRSGEVSIKRRYYLFFLFKRLRVRGGSTDRPWIRFSVTSLANRI